MPVDLRSDTVTRPTLEMYEAMAVAELDDDVLGHDPTTLKLERLAAEMLGKENAIFVPSGTMGNQIALATHTRPGDSVLFDDDAHMVFYECGAPAVVSGVQARTVPSVNGVIVPEEIGKRFLHGSHHTPATTLLCLENTHNRAGGTVTPVDVHARAKAEADKLGIGVHLDGARLFNAAVALGVQAKDIAHHVDTLSICLSKGLASPIGSVLAGPAEFIDRARFWRKRFGGGMRQSGILAACGIVSLTKMVDRLADDHRRAKVLADAIREVAGVRVIEPETNILIFETDAPAQQWVDKLNEHGVRVVAMDIHRVRAVFHKDVDDAGLDQTLDGFRKVANAGLG